MMEMQIVWHIPRDSDSDCVVLMLLALGFETLCTELPCTQMHSNKGYVSFVFFFHLMNHKYFPFHYSNDANFILYCFSLLDI